MYVADREVLFVVVDDVLRLGVVEAELAVHRLEAHPPLLEHALQTPRVRLALLKLRQYCPKIDLY